MWNPCARGGSCTTSGPKRNVYARSRIGTPSLLSWHWWHGVPGTVAGCGTSPTTRGHWRGKRHCWGHTQKSCFASGEPPSWPWLENRGPSCSRAGHLTHRASLDQATVTLTHKGAARMAGPSHVLVHEWAGLRAVGLRSCELVTGQVAGQVAG